MKFGQLIEYNMGNVFFFKNHAENEAGRLVPNLFMFLRKLYMPLLLDVLGNMCIALVF